MRLLIVTPSFLPDVGGVSRSLERIVPMLGGNADDVTVCCVREGMEFTLGLPHEVQVQECRFRLVEGFYEALPGVDGGSGYQVIQMRRLLESVLDGGSPDLVHLFYAGKVAFAAALECSQRGVPFLTSCRGSDIGLGLARPERHRLLEVVLTRAAHITFVSREMLDNVSLIWPQLAPKCTVVYNSFAQHLYDPVDSGSVDGEPIVGTVATSGEKKGIRQLLRALSGINCQLELLGNAASIRAELSYASELGVRVLVSAIQPKEVLRHYQTWHCFVQASPHEGCPNSLLEAIYAGVPIECTATGAARDLIEDGKNGLLVPCHNAEAIGMAVRWMLEHRTEALAMAAAAKGILSDQCSPDRECRAWRRAYLDCLQHADGTAGQQRDIGAE